MFKETSYTNRLTFFQKIRSIDLILIFCVLILGGISIFAMYSSEGGQMLYYTKSHFPLEISQRAFDHLWRVCQSYEMW